TILLWSRACRRAISACRSWPRSSSGAVIRPTNHMAVGPPADHLRDAQLRPDHPRIALDEVKERLIIARPRLLGQNRILASPVLQRLPDEGGQVGRILRVEGGPEGVDGLPVWRARGGRNGNREPEEDRAIRSTGDPMEHEIIVGRDLQGEGL